MKTKRNYLLSVILTTGAIIAILFLWSCKKENPVEIPRLGNLSTSDIIAYSAVIIGSLEYDGGTPLSDIGIVWNTTGTPSLESHDEKISASLNEDVFTITLTELLPGTNYYVRGYATNSKGTAYSGQIMFTTAGELATVTTAGFTEITVSSAVSGGEVTDEGGLEVTVRGVVWSTNENPGIDDNEGVTEDGSGPGEFTSALTGLSPETTYYVRAYATNSEGTGYGDQRSFETAPKEVACPTTFTDTRDGTVYKTVLLGDQCWLKENLKYLPGVHPPSDISATEAKYYVYDYQGTDVSEALATDNYNNYGVLYNWPAAMNGASGSSENPGRVQGVCPEGWHLPSIDEWKQLIDYLMGTYDLPNDWDDANSVGNALKSCRQEDSPLGEGCATNEHPRWNSNSTHFGTDRFGFSALPGGYLTSIYLFDVIGYYAFWWTSTDYSSVGAWDIFISSYSGEVGHDANANKEYGYSVRCVRSVD